MLEACWYRHAFDQFGIVYIFFQGADAEGRRALYSVPTEGGTPSVLVRYPDQSKPVWSVITVGDGVVYLSVTEHESDVYVMELEIR